MPDPRFDRFPVQFRVAAAPDRDGPERAAIGSNWSPEAHLGTLIHATLCQAMRMREDGAVIDQRAIDALWSAEWRNEAGALQARRPDLYLEARTMLRRYVASPHFQGAHIYRLTVADASGTPVERPMLEFGFHIEADGRAAAGRFDRVDMRAGRPVVVDYKTGSPEEGIGRHREQLLLYAVAIADLTGVTEVECEIHWVRTAVVSSIHFSAGDLRAARAAAVSWALRNPPLGGHNPPRGPRAPGQHDRGLD